MKFLNIGSLNYDKVYTVDHFVNEKETIFAEEYNEFIGGKGLNQSIALARAGANVYHAGKVGRDGDLLIEALSDSGVNVSLIMKDAMESGQAIIQNCEGQNCIIVNQGANGRITKEDIDSFLDSFGEGDILLVQNEISNIDYAIREAKRKKMYVCFNASPINKTIYNYPIEHVDILLVNEVEGRVLGKCDSTNYREIIRKLLTKFPNCKIVLTVGKDGAYYCDQDEIFFRKARNVEAVDTTGAGDTFTGYFLKCYFESTDYEQAMKNAIIASSLSVQKKGAANSIPDYSEVEKEAVSKK